MNTYGSRLMKMWRQHFPKQYAQLDDPEAFFMALGEQVEVEVQELAAALAGRDQPGEGYLGKVGRLNMARLAAEDEVFRRAVPAESKEEDEAEQVEPC